ncbi:MAG: tetratricopeptide repeat protein [Planctomycetota bacterium]
MAFYPFKKMTEYQFRKPWICAFFLCMMFINCNSASQCLADAQVDYLDPLDILISSSAETPNEPNIPQPELRITDTQPVIEHTQSVFPLDFTAPFQQENLTQNAPELPQEPASDPSTELFKTSVSILSNDDSKQVENELYNLIEQINSFVIEPQNTEPQKLAAGNTPEVYQDKVETEDETENEKTAQHSVKTELPYKPIADQTLQTLEGMAEQPQELDNPFELAELLFLSNYPDKAAVFYEEALTRTSTDSSISAQRKAWILFQIGNCLRKNDPVKAKQMYTQLINEFPESSWAGPAKSQVELIDWFQKDQPEKIVIDNNI